MAKKLAGILFVLCLALLAGGGTVSARPEQQAAAEGWELRDFGALDGETGWVWIGERLYWTGDAGANWREITPQTPGELAAVSFAAGGAPLGWAVATAWENGLPSHALLVTSDGGGSWTEIPLSPYADEFERGIMAPIGIKLRERR